MLLTDPRYAEHTKNIELYDDPLITAGVKLSESAELSELLKQKDGDFMQHGLYSYTIYNFEEDDHVIFGYVVHDGAKDWMPPQSVCQDVRPAIEEALGDLMPGNAEVLLYRDTDWRNVHLGTIIWDPFEADLNLDWELTPEQREMDNAYDISSQQYELISDLDQRGLCVYNDYQTTPELLAKMPKCWDPSLEVFKLPYQSHLHCCLIGKNINEDREDSCTIRLPSQQEIDEMDKKIKQSLGKKYSATLSAI